MPPESTVFNFWNILQPPNLQYRFCIGTFTDRFSQNKCTGLNFPATKTQIVKLTVLYLWEATQLSIIVFDSSEGKLDTGKTKKIFVCTNRLDKQTQLFSNERPRFPSSWSQRTNSILQISAQIKRYWEISLHWKLHWPIELKNGNCLIFLENERAFFKKQWLYLIHQGTSRKMFKVLCLAPRYAKLIVGKSWKLHIRMICLDLQIRHFQKELAEFFTWSSYILTSQL